MPQQADKEFPTGLYVNRPKPNAPAFVIGRISIKTQDFLEYLSEKEDEWVRIDIKEGFKVDEETNLKKWYAQTDTWKPKQQEKAQPQEEADDEPLPF